VKYVFLIEEWRTTKLGLGEAWNDEHLPSIDFETASLRANWHSMYFSLLRPFFEFILGQDFEDGVGAVDIHLLVFLTAKVVQSAIQGLIAYDRVGAEPDSSYTRFDRARTARLVLPNAFCTMHK
jgi:hypothetical protein